MFFIYRILICFFILLTGLASAQADELTDLLQQGQENLAGGYYREAEKQFSQAGLMATEQQDGYNQVLVKTLQAYMALQQQRNTEAEPVLIAALEQAKQNNWHDLTARINLYLGQLQENNRSNIQASKYFQQAVMQPEKIADKALLVSGFYQLAKLAIETNKPQQAKQSLQRATELMKALPENRSNSQLWLNIGYQNLLLYQLSPQNDAQAEAFSHLNTALALARQEQQPRTQAAALRHLASLYTLQHRNDEAIKLLLEGIRIAQLEDANDILIDLNWQIAQLYQKQNNLQLAIASYRSAVKNIDSIRIDIPVSYQGGRSSFRDTFAPIYLNLADLLLRQSGTVPAAQQQAFLAEARDSIEKMKKSELEDYFKSRCEISAKPIDLKKTDPHAAAIYPISLPDRLEIIVYTADGLHRFTSRVTAKDLEQQARLFSSGLRNYKNFSQIKVQAQFLHRWMIAPVDAFLKKHHIETLVYMPDAALRLVPLAALYNGKKFVIEDYAVVTSPGMSLIESDNTQHGHSMLLAGVSLPGESVSNLPDFLLTQLASPVADLITRSTKNTAERQLATDLVRTVNTVAKRGGLVGGGEEQQEKTRALRELLQNPLIVGKMQEILSLPGVETEIKQLAEQNNADYLLNDGFSLENFAQVLKSKPHSILHIASHGFFGNSTENSFIMAHDNILNLNQLEALLNSDYFRLHPIDLLTFSACQTAEGDDRSPLGMSGVAVKAKVHSALGSLWPVADEATAQLMITFYQGLNSGNQTKAKALQKAMLKVLKQKDFSNPSFWSPFILIGNWGN